MADLAHENGAVFILDSTTATPYLINPFDYGADIVVHSTSKYINGGGNSISGVIIDSGNFKWDYDKFKGLVEYKCVHRSKTAANISPYAVSQLCGVF